MKHPHHDLIVEWAADMCKKVEYVDYRGRWVEEKPVQWHPGREYRFKPEDVVSTISVEYVNGEVFWGLTNVHNIQITFSRETGKPIKAEVIND